MKCLIIAFATFLFINCSAQNPNKENIENAVRSTWDRPATDTSPKQSISVHSVRIGSSNKANLQDKIDGIPASSDVAIAQVDFTMREYYNDQTQVTHRLMTAKVFKDQFNEWACKSNGMKIIKTSMDSK